MPVLRFAALLIASALALAACDSTGSTDVETQAVVSAFLEVDAPLPAVTLTRTAPLGEFYDPATAAIRDASVRVERLGAGGVVEETIPYVYAGVDGAGTYTPLPAPAGRPLVAPGGTYRLVAEALGQTLTAETTVPASFRVVEPPPAELVYQVPVTGPPLRITLSSTPTRQSVYVATTASLAPDRFDPFVRDGETFYRSQNEPGRFRPVPFVADLVADCEEVGAFLECERDPYDLFRSGTSPIINEATYRRLGDGTAAVDVPWLAFGFYGPVEISLVALDDAFQDFVETQALQSGGNTLSPGEIPNVVTNVRGGLGVFGSFARVTVQTTVLER